MRQFRLVSASLVAVMAFAVSTNTSASVVVDDCATNFRDVASNVPSRGSVWASMAQSFVAPHSRITFGFRLRGAVPSEAGKTLIYNLYEGEISPLTFVGSRTVQFPDTLVESGCRAPFPDAGFVEADFSAIELIVGQTYSVEITVPSDDLPLPGSETGVGVWTSNANPYPDGRFYFPPIPENPVSSNNPFFAEQDMLFSIGPVEPDDAFPDDPVEDTDTDGDGIGDNGDAGGTGIGVRVVDAPMGCAFSGPVEAGSVIASGAPGTPIGLQLEYVLDGCGDTVTVEALFGEVLPAGGVAYKVTEAGDWTAIPGATIDGDTVTYIITDNGPLDADAVTGQITDPITVLVSDEASPPVEDGTEPIPVLSTWAFAILVLAIGCLGAVVLGWRRLSETA